MFKVGDKVVCVETGSYLYLTVGKVYDVVGHWGRDGVMVLNDNGIECHMFSRIFKSYSETEAEKRGAKFGTMGVVKATGERCVYIDDSLVIPGNWEIDVKGKAVRWHRHPSEIRLDHEPEYVAWLEAPEHLRYDASRVYFDGKPVKWIAKPEGASVDVALTRQYGLMEFSGYHLTVKL